MVIYKAEFPNGKVYIGKTKNFKNRKYQHKWNSERNHDKHIIVYKSIRKYGFDNIKWEILYECKTNEELSKKEIEYIKKYNSTCHKFGYNMVCGDKEEFSKRENFDKEYQVEIIRKKLKSNGHDPNKYIVIDSNLSNEIKNDYLVNKLGIRALNKKYKISRQRLTRFLKSENIEIDKYRASITNSIKLDDVIINRVISKFKNGSTIKKISKEENHTIQTISRILHDSGIRKSKRFKDGKRYDGKQPKKR